MFPGPDNPPPPPEKWFRRNPERVLLEKAVMAKSFPQFELILLADDFLRWFGPLETNRGNVYRLEVRYPDEFPDKAPQVYPLNPVIEAFMPGTNRYKHQYPDGHLCLHYPGDKTFSPKTTAAAVVAVAAAWFFSYETWLESGCTYWPGPEAPDIPPV